MGALPVAVADRAAPGFAIAFQPIVDIAGRRIVAQEALVRGLVGEVADLHDRVLDMRRDDLKILFVESDKLQL